MKRLLAGLSFLLASCAGASLAPANTVPGPVVLHIRDTVYIKGRVDTLYLQPQYITDTATVNGAIAAARSLKAQVDSRIDGDEAAVRQIVARIDALPVAGGGVTTSAIDSAITARLAEPRDLTAKSLTLVNSSGPVVTMGLSVNNEQPYPGRQGRLTFDWKGSYSSEIMTTPGPLWNNPGNIVGQFMQMGPLPKPGETGRKRLTSSLVMDGAGGLAAVLDASTTDPSGAPGQANAPPLCLNAGEAKGMYLCLYPGDNTVALNGGGATTGRVAFSKLMQKLLDTTVVGPVVVVPPSPTGITIPPLDAGTVSAVVVALRRNVSYPWQGDLTDRVASELAVGKYTMFDSAYVEGIKEMFYNGRMSSADRDAVKLYLNIIDQRDPATNQPLKPGDPRVAYVSGTAVVPVGPVPTSTSAVVTALAEMGIYVEMNRLGVGVRPDPNSQSALFIGGESAAEITGISNTKGTDGQNPGEVHKNSLVVADGDGGMRARQYATWGLNGRGMVRNTTNRPQTTFAFMDSMGNWCISDGRFGGQIVYGIKDDGNFHLVSFQQGKTILLQKSVAAYAASDFIIIQ